MLGKLAHPIFNGAAIHTGAPLRLDAGSVLRAHPGWLDRYSGAVGYNDPERRITDAFDPRVQRDLGAIHRFAAAIDRRDAPPDRGVILAPATIPFDQATLGLTDGEVGALQEMALAGMALHRVSLEQRFAGNPKVFDAIMRQGSAADARWFDLMGGPFDFYRSGELWLRGYETFIDLPARRPEGGGIFPPGTTRESFEAYLATLPEKAADAMRSHAYSIVQFCGTWTPDPRRAWLHRPEGSDTPLQPRDQWKLLPYHRAYFRHLHVAARHLERAAALVGEPTTAQYLRLCAIGLCDGFYNHDKTPLGAALGHAWMNLTGKFELTFGPDEERVEWVTGTRREFQAWIGLADTDLCRQIDAFKALLPTLDRELPGMDDPRVQPKNMQARPLRAANLLTRWGDGRSGYQAVAFWLPNDPIPGAEGGKFLLWANLFRERIEQIARPLANRFLPDDLAALLDWQHAFIYALAGHEFAHSLGAKFVEKDGKTVSVDDTLNRGRIQGQTTFRVLEEMKATIMGIHNAPKAMRLARGALPRISLQALYANYLAMEMRAIRIAPDDVYAIGSRAQFNYLMEKGALKFKDGRFVPVVSKFPQALADMVAEVHAFYVHADEPGATAWLTRYSQTTPPIQHLLDHARDLPVEVELEYAFEQHVV